MARAPAALSAALCLGGAGAHPLFGQSVTLPRLPEMPHHAVPGIDEKHPVPVVCWNASSRVAIAESSPYAGQAGDACATLDRDVCVEDATGTVFVAQEWYVVMFDNGYANQYRYQDLTPCKRGPAADGPYLIAQSAVIAASPSQREVEAAVHLVLQDALYETTLKDRNELFAAILDDSLTYCKRTKRCNISVSAAETNESSPFGNDTVVATNQGHPEDPDEPALLTMFANGPTLWPRRANCTRLWRVDYQVMVPTLRSALNAATLMQDLGLMPGLFHSAFEMVVNKRGWIEWYNNASSRDEAARASGAAVGSIVLSRPSLQHIPAHEWQDAEQPTGRGEGDAAGHRAPTAGEADDAQRPPTEGAAAFGGRAAIVGPAAAVLACLLVASCAAAAVLRRRRVEPTAVALRDQADGGAGASVEEGGYKPF